VLCKAQTLLCYELTTLWFSSWFTLSDVAGLIEFNGTERCCYKENPSILIFISPLSEKGLAFSFSSELAGLKTYLHSRSFLYVGLHHSSLPLLSPLPVHSSRFCCFHSSWISMPSLLYLFLQSISVVKLIFRFH
jgi:hypothetical protein